ncbi:hypothetical protein D3C79_946690 [compost metagenome]
MIVDRAPLLGRPRRHVRDVTLQRPPLGERVAQGFTAASGVFDGLAEYLLCLFMAQRALQVAQQHDPLAQNGPVQVGSIRYRCGGVVEQQFGGEMAQQ